MIERIFGSFLLLILIIIIARQIFYKFNIRKYSIIFGASHFILMGIISFLIFNGSRDAQWQLILIVPTIIDFPISMVCLLIPWSLTILMILMMVFGSLQYAFLGWLIDLGIGREKTECFKQVFDMKIRTVLKRAWIIASFAVLIATLILFYINNSYEVGILQFCAMALLTFPLGLVYVALASGLVFLLYHYFGLTVETNYFILVVSWLGWCIFGYIQWFKLIPFLMRLQKEKNRKE